MKTIEIEAKLIEQEHRLISILVNIYNSREYAKGDERKAAAYKALFHKLVFGSGRVAIFGGVLAVATVYFTAQQTKLLSEQNKLLRTELNISTANFNQQRWADNLKRRSELIKYIYGKDDLSNEPGFTAHERANALVEYIALQSVISSISFDKFSASGEMPLDTAMYKFGVDLSEANLQKIKLSQVDFRKTILYYANFSEAKIHWGNFNEVKLDWAKFSGAYLKGSNFNSASLLAADLRYTDLSNITWNEDTIISYANIHGVKSAPEGFLKWALNNGAVSIENTKEWDSIRSRLIQTSSP
jgi:uncharacterized protein YjbI with pentapeptide repeats